jgi:L-asparaginase
MNKNILIILTGGTFGMSEEFSNVLKVSNINGDYILSKVPEVKELANIEFVSIFNLDSSNMSPIHWENIGKTIYDNYSKYDGFVIIHGTDTMVYSGTALSFMMKDTEKPIIFTGSQRPLSKVRTDAKVNLINAVEFATLDIPEVCISFTSKLFRANRSKKIKIQNYKAFNSYNYPVLAKSGVNIEINREILRKKETPSWKLGFDSKIALLKIFPGMEASLLEKSLLSGRVKGLILEGFGSGNLPELDESWMDLIAKLKNIEVPTIITSQCNEGFVELNLYENGVKALKNGAISCYDITTEACVVKLMFAIKHFNKYNDLISFMKTPYCGEMKDFN